MIAGKVVALTGASSGIGEATATYLGRRGAKFVLGARGAEKLEDVRRRIVDAGGEAECVAIDVARREGVASLVARAQERFGRLDVFINNAGVMPIGKLDDLAVDDWERMIHRDEFREPCSRRRPPRAAGKVGRGVRDGTRSGRRGHRARDRSAGWSQHRRDRAAVDGSALKATTPARA